MNKCIWYIHPTFPNKTWRATSQRANKCVMTVKCNVRMLSANIRFQYHRLAKWQKCSRELIATHLNEQFTANYLDLHYFQRQPQKSKKTKAKEKLVSVEIAKKAENWIRKLVNYTFSSSLDSDRVKEKFRFHRSSEEVWRKIGKCQRMVGWPCKSFFSGGHLRRAFVINSHIINHLGRGGDKRESWPWSVLHDDAHYRRLFGANCVYTRASSDALVYFNIFDPQNESAAKYKSGGRSIHSAIWDVLKHMLR